MILKCDLIKIRALIAPAFLIFMRDISEKGEQLNI